MQTPFARLVTVALVGLALLIGLASALVEAVAPHGWDNLALILVPAGLVQALSMVS